MSIRLINKKTKEVSSFPADTAIINLRLEPDTYIPLNDETYIVRGEDGVFHKTSGKDLNRVLGDTSGNLVSVDDYAVESAVRAEYSKTGQFIKSLGSEALLLGLNKNKALPEDPLSKAIELKRRELFGGAEAAGSLTGAVAPFIAGGVGGVFASTAKAGAKKALGKGLKVAGKLPSAQVFKIADKAGGSIAKGLGKGTAVKAIATGGVFAGFEAGKAGLQEAVKTKTENEYKTTEDTMKSVLGAGVSKAGETFLSTSAFMAGVGGVLGVGSLAVKGVGAGGRFVKDLAGPKKLRETFFGAEPGLRGQKILQDLRTKFGSAEPSKIVKADKLKVSDDDLLRNTAQFLDDVVKPEAPTTKAGYLGIIKQKKDEVGKAIKESRKKMYGFFEEGRIEGLDKRFILEIDKLIKSEKGVLSATTHKGYVNTLKSIKKNLGEGFTPEKIHETLKVLSQKSKWLKREKAELGIDRAYRRAYSKLSSYEDELYSKIKELRKGGAFKNFKANKDYFSKLQTADDVMENALPTGIHFLGDFRMLDARSTILGAVGYSVAGTPGLLGAAAGSVALKQARNTGYRHLQIAKKMEQVGKVIGKNKSVNGVKTLLNKGSDLKTDLGIKGLSILFFGKGFNTLNEFEEQLNALPEYEKFTGGQDDLYNMAEEYGGRDNAVNFVAKSAQLKRDVISLIPEPTFDAKGNKVYTKPDKDRFLKVVSQGVTPQGFITSLKQKTLTQAGYDLLKRNYPDWLSEFNMNFLQGWKSGDITPEEGAYYRAFLRSQDSAVNDFIFSYMDREKRETPKRMLRKQQPTISQSVTGGY